MIRKIIVLLCILSFVTVEAQTKKPGPKGKGKPKTSATDSSAVEEEVELDPFEVLEQSLPLEQEMDPNTGKIVKFPDRKRRNDSLRADLAMKIKREKMTFWARTKYPKPKKPGPIQLCMNVVTKDTNMHYCVNDSVLMDPEVAKVLYQKQVGDTAYVLIFLDAFTKSKSDGGRCNAGHETRIYFVRWNTKTMQAKWKFKNIASCIKGITNMTKEPIANWNGSAPLKVSYHRGTKFYDILFDPEKPQLGIQSNSGAE